MVSYLHCQQKAFPLKKLLLYMCVKHSTFRKAKDNTHFFTCSMFLTIIFLLLRALVLLFACLFVLFCFYAGGKQKNRKMQSVHNTEFQKCFFHPSESKDQNEIVFSNLNVLFFLNGRTPEVLRCNLLPNMHCYIARNIFLKDLFSSRGRQKDTNDNRNYTSAIGNWWRFMPWCGHFATAVFQALCIFY